MEMEFLWRLLAATAMGAAIGIEREYHAKEAGIRTHLLVALGSCLFMILSAYGFDAFLAKDHTSFDPSRIASQVVTGIGFIGAGTIILQKQVVRGLTTAAGIWITAGIGLAIGTGMVFIALTVTAVICVLQNLIYRFFTDSDGAVTFVSNQLHFTVRNGYDFHQALTEQIERWHGVVQDSAYTRNQEEGTTDYDLIVQSRKEIPYSEMKEFIAAHEEIISCTNNAARK